MKKIVYFCVLVSIGLASNLPDVQASLKISKEGKLSYNNRSPSAKDVHDLAKNTRSQAINVLTLVNCKIGNEGLKQLIDSENLQNITVLDLTGNDIDDDGLELLLKPRDNPRQSYPFENLETLLLIENNITDAGANNIVADLTTSYLDNDNILPSLKLLNMRNNRKITSIGLQDLNNQQSVFKNRIALKMVPAHRKDLKFDWDEKK